ncbi:Transcription factor [Ceratobasidium theobromae]|uniref:Transcription factor n=1 Tax=Ceratobasidium theobromae TaxID=1582974 RepID=A0A5N5QWY9_9AGAM|nr:Transcription factor [Ceratobasidium theobromae]
MDVPTNTFCASGMHLPNGSWATFGGNAAVGPGGNVGSVPGPIAANSALYDDTYKDWDGRRAVRILNPCAGGSGGAPECQWFDNTTYVGMQKPRWYSSAEALGDGSIVIVGGFVTGGYINRNTPNVDPAYSGGAAEPTFEFWPNRGTPAAVMQFMVATSGLNSYAHLYLLPSGRMFVQANYSTSKLGVCVVSQLSCSYLGLQCKCGNRAGGDAWTGYPGVPSVWGGGDAAADAWQQLHADDVVLRGVGYARGSVGELQLASDQYLELPYRGTANASRRKDRMGRWGVYHAAGLDAATNGTAGYATQTGETAYGMPFGMSLAAGPVLTPAIYDANVDVNLTTYTAERFFPPYFANIATRPVPEGMGAAFIVSLGVGSRGEDIYPGASEILMASPFAGPVRRPRGRPSPELNAASTRTKNGCWSCRVRRKCDEGSAGCPGSSCNNCARLEIECLGWGAKRPEWMKAKVEAWKTSVTQSLKDKGMIRGVPRTNPPAPPPFAYGPRHSEVPTQVPEESDEDYFLDQDMHTPVDFFMFDPVEEVVSPEVSASLQYVPPVVFGPVSPYVADWASYQPQPDYSWNTHNVAYQPVYEFAPVLRTPTVGLDQDRLRNMLILYYFKHVRQMQYVFAGELTTNVMLQHAQMDPQGVVSLALCSLAALHDSRMRIANGIMPNDHRARGPADKYYQKALARLQDNKQRTGRLSDADATAALHFVSFWLFTGGAGDWPTALDIAGDWYEQSDIASHENPMRALMEMNDNAKHASKTTMWMDIFSSISLCKSPRFLKLYRRLLQPTTLAGQGLQLENVMGCADGIMLCLAEIAHLAHWKSTQQAAGSLSMPELVRRGLVIEKDLRREGYALYRSQDGPSMWGSVPPRATNVDLPAGIRLGQSPPSSPPLPNAVLDGSQLRRLVSDIFREAAILYLHTELSELAPQVPEIMRAVIDTVEALQKLPPSEYDRSLVFPLALVGCATDDPDMREYVRGRIKQLSSAVGNCATAGELIEHVWKRRDDSPGLVLGWRDAMQEINTTILLV